MITRQDRAISLFNLCHTMGVDMSVIDITSFVCSKCENPIPDRFLDQAYFHSTGNGVAVTCQDCHDEEQRDIAKRFSLLEMRLENVVEFQRGMYDNLNKLKRGLDEIALQVGLLEPDDNGRRNQ